MDHKNSMIPPQPRAIDFYFDEEFLEKAFIAASNAWALSVRAMLAQASPDISAKLEQRESEAAFRKRCLKVCMCPLCGSDLERKMERDGGYTYRCIGACCGFTYSA